jgi:hypothetical protein
MREHVRRSTGGSPSSALRSDRPTEARNTVEVEPVEADAREDAISQQQPLAVACVGPLGDDRIFREVGRGGVGGGLRG